MISRHQKALSLQVAVGLCALTATLGCGRSAAPKAAPERAEPAAAAPAAEGPAQAEAPPPADDSTSDRAAGEKKEKSTEEPSLSQAPAEEALGPQAGDDDELDRLDREERQFQKAIDPEALSCAGALPRRDAICTLAHKICELVPPTSSLSAQKDCEKAQSACTNAKASYRNRCGG